MTDLFDADGNLVEGYLSEEEVNQKLDEERAKAIDEANADRQSEIDEKDNKVKTLEESLGALQTELDKEKNKDKNLGGQRKIIEEKEKAIEELKKTIDEIKTGFETKFNDLTKGGLVKLADKMRKELSGGDKAIDDKIKFFYDGFKGDPKDETEVSERVKNAYTLATGGTPRGIINHQTISAAGGEMPPVNTDGQKLSPESQEVAKKLGLTDKDLKTHKLI